jgi:hypothetical protein
LTSQPTGLGQSKRQIQHVVLVVVGLGHFVVQRLVLDNNMACRAGAGAAASALHFEVVGLCNVEQVGAVGDGEGVGLRVFVDEGYCASTDDQRMERLDDVGGAYSSPGFGVSRWPWRGVGVEENWRVVWKIGTNAVLRRIRHDDVLRFASLIPRCDVAVPLLDLLENFRRLDDALDALDENPLDWASTLIQVRRDAMMLAV